MAITYHLVLLSVLLPLAGGASLLRYQCGKNFTGDGILASNIGAGLADLVRESSLLGSANSTRGAGDNTIYGLSLCRGDVTSGDCSTCIADAAGNISAACAGHAQAIVWYDICLIRFDTEDFNGKWKNGSGWVVRSSREAPNPSIFVPEVEELIRQVTAAAAGAGGRLFGRMARVIRRLEGLAVYGMAQCTRDLEGGSCRDCLDLLAGWIPVAGGCRNSSGCNLLYSSCVIRYETYNFLSPVDASSSASLQF
ncbi:Cysteine-rich repeat secretory protein 55 [Apostasia shenzhenica]|uniref:Cysteine-rich repeat secretory protein 55 n=1 Tax=Apostasia shenzhenica TaxID=1088818 RepID=A0A2I0B8X1_9ASPA|nr:Cysteine-rich repeat secretory protein 55 [Apostasia shenzhenica]